MKHKGAKDLLEKATDWRTLMIFGVAIAVVISFSRYCDILHVGALQAYILFPLSFFILSQLIYKKQMWRNKDMWLAAAVFFWTVVSLLINSDVVETPLLSGDYQHLCVSIFLCYPLAGALEPEQRRKAFRLLAAINVVGVTLLCCFALYCVIFGVTPDVPFACESPLRIYYVDRLCLFTNPNGSGIYCQVAALLCIYLILSAKRVWERVLESIGLVCIVCALAMTGSRTAIFSFAAGIGMLGYLLVSRASCRKVTRSKQVLLAVANAILTAILCVVIVVAARKAALWLKATNAVSASTGESSTLTIAVPNVKAESYAAAEALSGPLAAPATAAADVAATPVPVSEATPEAPQSSGGTPSYNFSRVFTLDNRTTIWKCILQTLPEKEGLLLHGVSSYADSETFEKDFPPTQPHSFHNSYLSILVCYGIPGLVVWLAFLVAIYTCGVRVFFAPSTVVDLPTAFLMSLLVSGFLVGMMESVLFVDGLPQASHTWLMLAGGMAVTENRERVKYSAPARKLLKGRQ